MEHVAPSLLVDDDLELAGSLEQIDTVNERGVDSLPLGNVRSFRNHMNAKLRTRCIHRTPPFPELEQPGA
jgi:hypothetical protein